MKKDFSIDWRTVVFAAVVAYASWIMLAGKHIIHGDGTEYILQTQAIAFHGRLQINTTELREYWNRTNPYGVTLPVPAAPNRLLTESAQAGGRWGGLYPDRTGAYRYYHFWAYPLAAAPVYLLLHRLAGAPFEYHAFRILNWLLLLSPFIAAWTRRRRWMLAAILALSLFSPLVPYTDWQHPELFCFWLIFFAFWLAASKKGFWWSPLLLGIATAQNIPIGLLFPLHFFHLWRHHEKEMRSSPLLALGAYGLAAGVAGGSLLYWQHHFGCFNPIAALGLADMKYAGLGRVCDIFFSPTVGAAWLYPTLFLFMPLMLRRRDVPLVAMALVTAAGMAYLASATRNFNAGQVGSLRYAVWIFAPLWYFLLAADHPENPHRKAVRTALVAIAVAANILMIVAFKYDRLVKKDIRRTGGAWRGIPEVAAIYAALPYNDDIEITVETILGHELAHPSLFRGVYIWNLGPHASRWVIARQGMTNAMPVEWKTATPIAYRTIPAGNTLFQFTNGMARLVIPPNARYKEHPYLGKYITVWMDAAVDDPKARVETAVRP
jgi:hypothetical protein